MKIDKARNEFEASFLAELDVDLSGNRHTDSEGLECYQFDGDDEDERSKMASIAFLFWQASRESLVIELPPVEVFGSGVDDFALCPEKVRNAIHASGLKTK